MGNLLHDLAGLHVVAGPEHAWRPNSRRLAGVPVSCVLGVHEHVQAVEPLGLRQPFGFRHLALFDEIPLVLRVFDSHWNRLSPKRTRHPLEAPFEDRGQFQVVPVRLDHQDKVPTVNGFDAVVLAGVEFFHSPLIQQVAGDLPDMIPAIQTFIGRRVVLVLQTRPVGIDVERGHVAAGMRLQKFLDLVFLPELFPHE